MRMHNIAITVLVLALLLSGCGQEREPEPGSLTAAEFTEAYMEKLRSADPSLSVKKVGELELQVGGEQDDEHSVFLDNAYKEYHLAPEDIEQILDRYTQSILGTIRMPDIDAIDIARIVPVIKDAEYPVEIRKSLLEAGQKIDELDFFYETLNEHLLVFYALDTERNIRYLSREEIETLSMQPEELRAQAVKNLSSLLPGIQKHGDAGTFMVTAGGTYEASLLLFDSIWSSDNFNVDGELVVAIPSRDLLLVTGSRDKEGLEQLRKLAVKTVEEASYRLTPELFVRKEGGWLPFRE
jgi:uncharacterized protein YtpQ (UPF0354 family)